VFLEAQRASSDQEQQFDQLQERYEAESDPTAKEALGHESDEREQEIDRQRVAELHDRWTKETDAKGKKRSVRNYQRQRLETKSMSAWSNSLSGQTDQ
jgi:hypothetical protein